MCSFSYMIHKHGIALMVCGKLAHLMLSIIAGLTPCACNASCLWTPTQQCQSAQRCRMSEQARLEAASAGSRATPDGADLQAKQADIDAQLPA